jgi:hypothetical protein
MDASNVLKLRWFIVAATLTLAGCNPTDFNYGKVKNIIEGSPVRLDAEYVMLSGQQIDCGVQNELWDAPTGMDELHKTAHLTQKARDLKFADDVILGELPRPYVQIRGDFNLAVIEITSDKDGPEPNTRLVQTKVGIVVPNACFPEALPLMGVRKGSFSQEHSPVLLFRLNGVWQLDHIVH